MTGTDSAELREVYERQYDQESVDTARAGRWRALCAEGKADHVARLVGGLSPRTVVEVGCGEGVLLAELKRRGVGEVLHGFDISEQAVELARGRPEIERVERFDGLSIPAEDGAYDLGVLSHVLEHVPDPVPLLRETARVARAVVVEVPLEDNRSASRASAAAGRERVGHLHRFSRSDVRELAASAGLRVADELADPLPAAVHVFWAETRAQRLRGLGKAALRRAAFSVARRMAERAFTLHYACLLVPDRVE